MRLVTTSKSSITQLAATNEGSIIYMIFIGEDKVIKKDCGNDNNIDDLSIITINSIRSIKIFKLAKFKNLM